VVMANVADPVGLGLVASLARLGGNVTGFSSLVTELNSKRLEILKDAIPKLSRVGVLRSPGVSDFQLKELRAAAPALNLRLEEIDTPLDPKGLESAFQTGKQKQVNAIMTMATRTFFAERKRIVELQSKDLPVRGERKIDREHERPQRANNNLIAKYTFDNFVIGASNQFAHAASMAVANQPGEACRQIPVTCYLLPEGVCG